MSWSILPYVLIVGTAAVAITILFVLGPAATVQSLNRSLFEAVETSVGSIPALAVRFCCIAFFVIWMANLIVVPGLWWVDSILRRDSVSSSAHGLMAVGILALVLATGLQSTETTGKLAKFTNKLGLAIFVAALFRVREGWPDAVNGFPHGDRNFSEVGHGISRLVLYTAPLGFMVGSFGNRVRGRKQLALTVAMGFALPLFVTLLLIGFLNVATIHSPLYQPSTSPNVLMPLWAHAAPSSLPARMLLVVITMFGAQRFGMRSLAESISAESLGKQIPWARLVLLSLVIAVVSVEVKTASLLMILQIPSACLVVVSAVLSADYLRQSRRFRGTQGIDRVGLISLLAGLASALCWQVITKADPWYGTWVLPSYAGGFIACFFGRSAVGFHRRPTTTV